MSVSTSITVAIMGIAVYGSGAQMWQTGITMAETAYSFKIEEVLHTTGACVLANSTEAFNACTPQLHHSRNAGHPTGSTKVNTHLITLYITTCAMHAGNPATPNHTRCNSSK